MRTILLRLLVAAAGCGPDPCRAVLDLPPADVFAIGDSALAFGSGQCVSAIDFASLALGRRIRNEAVGGTEMLGGPRAIPTQVPPGAWSTGIVIGGGNDLALSGACDGGDAGPILDQLATADGQEGAVPALVDGLVERGTAVLLLGYYRTPQQQLNRQGPCSDELTLLGERYRAVAELRPEVTFLDLGQAIGVGDLELLAPDLVHPAPDGAEALGSLIADALRDLGT